MPPGTIIPELVYPDLDAAVDWLCRAKRSSWGEAISSTCQVSSHE